ncbi:MAG: beta-lactamase family protein, partial [Thermomicrobiales bacterium]|nr:beta-lactamase family protein [Thermomicrobiales bacterium]
MNSLSHTRLTRRGFMKAASGAAAGASLGALLRKQLSAASGLVADPDWESFDRALETGMLDFEMVGAAVSVLTPDEVAYSGMFGVRDLETAEPVTEDTHFLVASTTKSMTAALIATFVDDGVLAWDQPVREIYPHFRAPTDELTETLRVRDMLDMASGIGESDASAAFHQGDPTTDQLLASLVNLPVVGAKGAQFFYNGAVYAAGGYLPALALGIDPADVGPVYASQIAERIYRPSGMATACITDDPRPFSDNFATGYGPDLLVGTSRQPFAPVGSYAPAGGTLATHGEMVRYVMMQLNRGVAHDGARIVSSENLTECWTSNVDVPYDADLTPDIVQSGYGMGWLTATYRDGRRFISHAGGIDGFTTFLGFLPEDGIGLVVNTNMMPPSRGLAFIQYVSALLLETSFGLNTGASEMTLAQYRGAAQTLDDLAQTCRLPEWSEIAPWLGHYEKGWLLAFDEDGSLRLRQSSRSIPLVVMPDGSYVMASGIAPGIPVHFS